MIKRHASVLLGITFAVTLLAGCGDKGNTTTPANATAKPSDTGAAQKLYVINSANGAGADTILAFSPTATGTATPALTITAPTSTSAYAGLDVDGNNNIYASTRTGSGGSTAGTINIYNASGSVTRTFSPANTSGSLITYPGALSVDRNGNIYVNSEALELAYAPSTATGNINASYQLAGGSSQIYYPSGSSVDAQNNFYLAQTFSTTGNPQGILIFNSGVSATSAPARTLVGALTTFNTVSFVAGDKNGNVYVTGTSSAGSTPQIAIFSNTATGNIAPTKVISGSNTLLDDPRGIAVDGNGTIYVLNGARSTPTISTFSASSISSCTACNVAPATSFTSTALTRAQGAIAIY